MLTIIDGEDKFRARDHREDRHFWADKELVEDYLPQIGIHAFGVYMLLAYHARSNTGRAWPSIRGMAERLGLSEPTIRKSIDCLAQHKLIHVASRQQTTEAGNSRALSHVYTLLELKHHTDSDQSAQSAGVVNGVDQGGKPPLPGVVNGVDPNNNNINNNNLTDKESLSNTLRVSTGPSIKPQSIPASGKDTPPVPVPPPNGLTAPEGFQMICAKADRVVHLGNASAAPSLAKPLCKTKLGKRGEPGSTMFRCEECWKIAAKPKRKRPDLTPPPAEIEELFSVKVYGSVGACRITKNHWAIVSTYSGLLKCGFPVDKDNINKFCAKFRDPQEGHWKGKRGEYPRLEDFTQFWCAVMEGKGFTEATNGHNQNGQTAGVLRGQGQKDTRKDEQPDYSNTPFKTYGGK